MAAVIEVEDLPLTERVDVLREHMLRAAVPLELRPVRGIDLRAKSSVADFGRIHLLSTLGSGATVIRTPRLARDETEPSLIVSLLEAGDSVLCQTDRRTRLATGEPVAYTTTAPYWSTFQTNTLRHSFQVPVSELQLPDRVVGSHVAIPLTAQRLLADIVGSHLGRLVRSAPALDPTMREEMERPTLDLIRSLLAVNAGDERLARQPLGATLDTRIFEFARLHLGDREVGAPMIADAFGISERYVYMIFRKSGLSVGEWIRERRIDAGADLLIRPGMSHISITTIAHRLGFADHAHFTRTFRRVRGMTPSDWRRAQVTGPTN